MKYSYAYHSLLNENYAFLLLLAEPSTGRSIAFCFTTISCSTITILYYGEAPPWRSSPPSELTVRVRPYTQLEVKGLVTRLSVMKFVCVCVTLRGLSVAAECFSNRHCLREVPGSNYGQKTSYPNRCFLVLNIFGQMTDKCLLVYTFSNRFLHEFLIFSSLYVPMFYLSWFVQFTEQVCSTFSIVSF